MKRSRFDSLLGSCPFLLGVIHVAEGSLFWGSVMIALGSWLVALGFWKVRDDS